MRQLTVKTVRTLSSPGMYGDGGALFLCVMPCDIAAESCKRAVA